jgi:V/A-type H+-transporting ATPase subunit A
VCSSDLELDDIIKLVGMDALSPQEKVLLDTARGLREDYLQQNAFDDIDAFASTRKMYLMLKAMITFHREAPAVVADHPDIDITALTELDLRDTIARLKQTPESEIETVESIITEIHPTLQLVLDAEGSGDFGINKTVSGM